MEEKPSYYAVIPANVRYDPDLKDKAKLLYGEISALSNKTGECYATNNYFAKLFKVTPETISRLIKNLKDKNYIRVVINYKKNSKEVDYRLIKISNQFITIPKNYYKQEGIDENVNRYCQNNQEGIDKKIKDNNTRNNNNPPYIPPRETKIDYLKKFEVFWNLYPKKQNKKKVESWFKRNNPDEELMKIILEKLELFKKTEQWQKNNKQFVPMPTTWLNGHRWEDEIILENDNDLSNDISTINGYEVL